LEISIQILTEQHEMDCHNIKTERLIIMIVKIVFRNTTHYHIGVTSFKNSVFH